VNAHERRQLLLPALRSPRGRYPGPRAAQLSGVPRSTVYDWAREGVLVPDYAGAKPRLWSYRDLVFLRLLARMRHAGIDRAEAAADIAALRERLSRPDADITKVRIRDGLFVGDATEEIRTGQRALPDVLGLVQEFDLLEPIEGVSKRAMWGPDLLQPSPHTYISPQVMGGEPCVDASRVPTASVMALVEQRGLSSDNVVRLYPQLTAEGVADAVDLEQRMRNRQAA
jgi:uncharacterized protein (DUF433 family)/DNA-binding transcriptional MerR regulator